MPENHSKTSRGKRVFSSLQTFRSNFGFFATPFGPRLQEELGMESASLKTLEDCIFYVRGSGSK
ncbi:MAG: hypothetical protein ACKN82_20110, partial [Pirellula sp.]